MNSWALSTRLSTQPTHQQLAPPYHAAGARGGWKHGAEGATPTAREQAARGGPCAAVCAPPRLVVGHCIFSLLSSFKSLCCCTACSAARSVRLRASLLWRARACSCSFVRASRVCACVCAPPVCACVRAPWHACGQARECHGPAPSDGAEKVF